MNKVFKVIWNEARNAYVVVSEIAKNHGSKSCSTKKLLAMLIATGVMTCASFDVLAAEPSGTDTAKSRYVAFADPTHTLYSGNKTTIDGHEYIYDATNKYWVRKGYKLVVEENGAMHTPLSDHGKSSDVAYIGNGDKDSILQSVASMVSASGTVTNMGESLNKITASGFVGVSHSGGTAVDGTWHYIIHDPTWEGAVAQGNYEDGYVDLVGKNMPKGFVTADDNKGLIWDDDKQAYNYKGKPVDYSNVYVIDGKIGVFTNKDGSDFYEGTVFGKNNEILMTVKDDNGHFYSYWASAVTDPSATMSTYRLAEYKKDLSVLVENDEKLSRNDIKEVTLDTTQANSATIGLLRNGDTEAGAPVKGAITVTSGGGTGGSGAANDTFVKISNGTANQTFATGSKVEVNGPANAITGIKVNGVDYTIKQGSGVEVTQDTTKKTTTITVDGTATTITDTDTTYTAGKGIAISDANAISVKLNKDEKNLVVDSNGLALNKNLTVDSVKAGDFYMSTAGIGYGDKAYITSSGLNANGQTITNVKAGEADTDAVNVSQLNKVSATAKTEVKAGTNIVSVDKTTGANGQDIYTVNAKDTTYAAGNGITISGENNAIAVNLKAGENNLEVTAAGLALKKDLNVDSVKAGEFYMSNAGIGYGDKAYITSSGMNANNQKITNVKAGEAETDAVNVSQLNNVKAEAGKHTTLVAGDNVQVKEEKTDNGLKYTVSATDTTYTAGNGIAINGENNAISVKLKAGEGNLVVDKDGLALNKDLQGIASISNGDAKLTLGAMGGMVSEFTNGQGASVKLFGDITTINGKVNVYKDGRIAGVADGVNATDAVNVSQLQKAAVASATTVSDGVNTTVTATKAEDGHTDYKVNLNKNLKDIETISNGGATLTLGAMGGMVAELANGQGASVKLFGDTTTINGKVNVYKDGRIAGVADGVNANDAVNVSQLQKAAAASAATVTDGVNTTVTTTTAEDGHVDYKVNLNKNLTGVESISNGGASLTMNGFATELANGQGASVKLFGDTTTINGKVNVYKDGRIAGVADGVNATDAVNVSQLQKAAAASATTVSDGVNTTVTATKAETVIPITK